MIRDYKHLIKLQHLHTEQMRESEMIVRDVFAENYADCSLYDEIILQPQQR